MNKFVSHSDENWFRKLKRDFSAAPKQEIAVGFPRGNAGLTTKIYPLSSEAGAKRRNIKIGTHRLNTRRVRTDVEIGGGASILDLAVRHQFGTKNIPARPFMTYAVKPIQDQAKETLEKLIDAVNQRKSKKPLMANLMERICKALGMQAAAKLREVMLTSGLYKPNAAKTIARKGSATPLVDTGTMVKAATFVVRERT